MDYNKGGTNKSTDDNTEEKVLVLSSLIEWEFDQKLQLFQLTSVLSADGEKPNLEYRNPKQIRMTKWKILNLGFGIWDLGFGICFGFRYSDFEFMELSGNDYQPDDQ